MNIDDVIKLLLGLAVAFSLAGISFQIMRIISKATDMMQDLRKAVQNISTASDMMVEDYSEARKAIKGVIALLNNLNESVVEPITGLFKMFDKFTGKRTKAKAPDTSEL